MTQSQANRPPQPHLWQALGSLIEPLRFFTTTLETHPDLFYSGLLGFKAFVVHHPELVRRVLYDNASNYRNSEKHDVLKFLTHNGLVTNQGESWLRQRRLVQPAFKHNQVQGLFELIQQETQTALETITRQPIETININALMGELTIGIISKALFSTQAVGYAQTIRHELDVCQRMGNLLLRAPWRWPEQTPQFPIFKRFRTAIERLDTIVHNVIQERRNLLAQGQNPTDLLNALMHATDPENPNSTMGDRQLRDEVLTLLLVGHETTLLALSWTFEQLAWHPQTQHKLWQQLKNTEISLEELQHMLFLDGVLYESMRLRPPVYILARQAIQTDHLASFEVPPGMNVLVNVYGLHRHPRHWPEPDRFWPERFAQLDLNAIKHCFLPFGAGPRQCIGNHLAMLEMRVIVAQMLQVLEFRPLQRKPMKPTPMITLKTARDIVLRVRRR